MFSYETLLYLVVAPISTLLIIPIVCGFTSLSLLSDY